MGDGIEAAASRGTRVAVQSDGGVQDHSRGDPTSGPTETGVPAEAVATALSNWEYDSSPTPAAALASYLAETFPSSSVERNRGRWTADIVVDGVAVALVDDLGRGFRTDFRFLADTYDELVCYSTSPHRTRAGEWRSFVHRNRGDGFHFVTRGEPAAGWSDGADSTGTAGRAGLAVVPLAMLAIAGLFGASLGLFTTGWASLGGWTGVVAVGAITGFATAVGLLAAVRGSALSTLLRRLAQ